MKVFISWSGDLSRGIATLLHKYLPYIIQSIKPFVSSVDISTGTRWNDVVVDELKDSQYGIVCLTPYNVSKPWINFEAGALSNSIGRPYVSPILFNIEPAHVQGPLSQFQAVLWSKDGIDNLLSSINNRLEQQEQLDHERLRETSKVWWKIIEKEAAEVSSRETGTRSAYEWLYTLEDLVDHEARSDYNAVWIITPDVYKHFLKPEAKERFETNIQNNVTYRYFIREPGHCDSVRDLEQLRTRAAEVPNKLAVKSFSEKEFNTESATDYIIMNANSDSKHPLRVFLRLPVEQAGTEYGAEYWIRVEDEAAGHFVGRFTKMWESKIEQESAAGRGTGTQSRSQPG